MKTSSPVIFIALVAIFGATHWANAQGGLGQPANLQINGKMVQLDKYVNVVEGTPFYNTEYEKATVVLTDGRVEKNVMVKLNLQAKEMWFLNQSGQEVIASDPINAVIFINGSGDTSGIFITKYTMDSNVVPDGWYELMKKGEASLLKEFFKSYTEHKEYGASTPKMALVTEERFFVWSNQNHKFTRVKNLQDIAEVLNSPEVNNYMASKKKNSKSENDFKEIIGYYNTSLKK